MSWNRHVNVGIAKSHQFAGQLIGMQLAVANVLAQVVSAASVVAGATMLAIQQFPSAWPLWITAAGIGIGLALLIEGLTLGALIRIRVAGREIRETEQALRKARDAQLSKLTVLDPNNPNYQLLTTRMKQLRKLIEREYQRTCKQALRQARRDRRSSLVLALGGCLASMCGGGLFYHAILGGLGQIASVALSAIFTLAVTGTFVSSEIFKDLQEQAIRENFVNGNLAESAMRQETRMQSLWAVHQHIGTYLQTPEAQEVISGGSNLLVTSILEELHQDLRRSLAPTKPHVTGTLVENVSHVWPGSITSLVGRASETDVHEQATETGMTGLAQLTQRGNMQEAQAQESCNRAAREPGASSTEPPTMHPPLMAQAQLEPLLTLKVGSGEPYPQQVPEPSLHDPEPQRNAQIVQPVNQQKAGSSGTTLDQIGLAMVRAIERAVPEEQEMLFQLAQQQTLLDFAQTLQERYPGYASFFTEERVAGVMAFARQSLLDIRPKEGSTLDASPLGTAQAQQKQNPLLIPLPSGGSDAAGGASSERLSPPVGKNVRQLQVTRLIHEAQKQHAHTAAYRDRIQAVMIQAQQAGVTLNYRQIAQATGVSYSTVKRYAPALRTEPQE